MPLVSVIIPNYNHAPYLKSRIESVLAQSFVDYEIILMDDASTDESKSVIEEYASNPCVSRVVLNEINGGGTFRQWNKGVQAASGEYIWIAESDDYADPLFLEKMLSVLKQHDDISLVFCESFLINNKSALIGGTKDWRMPHEDWEGLERQAIFQGIDFCGDYLTIRCAIPNASAVLFRKRYYEMAGGGDESFKMSGDWKLWFNMLLISRGGYVSAQLNYFRCHIQNVRTAKEHLQKIEALRNLKQFHRQLLKVKRLNFKMLESIFLWSFKKNLWTSKLHYSAKNTRIYFKDSTWPMVVFFFRYKFTTIVKVHFAYRLKKCFRKTASKV